MPRDVGSRAVNSASPKGPAEIARSPQPVWLETLEAGLSVHSHFILSGNVRDLFAAGESTGLAFFPLEDILLRMLRRSGIETLVTYDLIDGAGFRGDCDPAINAYLRQAGISLEADEHGIARLAALIEAFVSIEIPVALLVGYGSHLAASDAPGFERLLVLMDKVTRRPAPRSGSAAPDRNPIFWIVDRSGDLPDWFVVKNREVREVRIDLPDLEERFAFCQRLSDRFPHHAPLTPAEQRLRLQQFALQTEGMSLCEIQAVAEVASRQGLGLDRTDDAIRSFRTGMRRNPWKSPILLERLKQAQKILRRRVKGQEHAIARVVQILTRSVMGLSGSQTSSRLNRPRGVMFFAGPTGVGKTELAKAVTELLFGDEAMCHRFDMTEFNSERSVARLIGAPPGYAGHEKGGELTNAMRQRPFSVILFDEVEKAHPRVLDMFLQILDEGRLTDSRGEPSYFSDAIIIFTSNVGMLGKSTATNLGMEILPSDSYESLRSKLLDGIHKHFFSELKRPELLNRIGHNIVAFDFIHGESVELILFSILKRVLDTVLAELDVEVTIAEGVLKELSVICGSNLMDGGRGIANSVEANFINPLAEALLDRPDGRSFVVESINLSGGAVRLKILPTA